MSDSWNTEQSLRKLAEKLHAEAASLEEAADVLANIRNAEMYAMDLKQARAMAREWMKR